MKKRTIKRLTFVSTLLVLSVLLSGCFTSMTHARFPSSITKGSSASGPNQWFARVALTNEAAEGVYFRFVVWLHVPTDWTLPWATQYSFTGDFQNTTLTQDGPAQTWISTASNCGDVGGPADSGYKWRGFIGPIETMPVAGSSRYNNRVNLRGGLGVPGSETSDAYTGVAMVTGVMFDGDADNVPDTFNCNGGANTTIVVP